MAALIFTIANLQALIWYHQKDLRELLGGKMRNQKRQTMSKRQGDTSPKNIQTVNSATFSEEEEDRMARDLEHNQNLILNATPEELEKLLET